MYRYTDLWIEVNENIFLETDIQNSNSVNIVEDDDDDDTTEYSASANGMKFHFVHFCFSTNS